jgi:glucose/arabinose dehydrogenase
MIRTLPLCALLMAGAATQASAQNLNLQLTEVYSGLMQPVFVTHAGDGSGRLFIVEQIGRVRIARDGVIADQAFLQLDMGRSGSEQGLLGLAFAPDYPQSGRLYVNYTNSQGNTEVVRFTVSSEDPDRVDLATAQLMLTIGQPFSNHNGGWLGFGPDGYLYIASGDGGNANDPDNHGQRLDTLLGKILRIDVAGDVATIPPDNPFVNTPGARPEIWAYGLRNPWRASFDRHSGDLWIADVGQSSREEVNFQPATAGGGQNYGWRTLEGTRCLTSGCSAAGTTLPVTEYDHSLGCSVSGGYVYRGSRYPNLRGQYLFGDFCSGRVFALRRTGSGATASSFTRVELGFSGELISSFGEDEQGNVYLVGYGGRVHLLSDGAPVADSIDPLVTGTWFDPQQDGHGWLTEAIEVGGEQALLATWYTYLDGEPVWLIGVGAADADEVVVPLTITRGGGFTPGFDPASVLREHWGEARFRFPGGQQASVSWDSSYPGFGSGSMPLTRLVYPAPDEAGTPSGLSPCHSGTWYQPAEDGHGLQVQVFGYGAQRQLLAVWYAYLDGTQRWMLGLGPVDGDSAHLDMISADGPGFPPDFDPGQVTRRTWGTLDFTVLDADTARIAWDSVQPGYGSGSLDLVRLTRMRGRECRSD